MGIIKVREEINEIDNRKTIENLTRLKPIFLKDKIEKFLVQLTRRRAQITNIWNKRDYIITDSTYIKGCSYK